MNNEVLVLNMDEAEIKAQCSICTCSEIESAAQTLLLSGFASVFIQGNKLHHQSWTHDYWTNGARSFWLTQRRYDGAQDPKIKSIFLEKVKWARDFGYSLEDALVIASMYVRRGIRLAQTEFHHGGFPEDEIDIPYVSSTPLVTAPKPFKRAPHLGLYPVVDSSAWVETLLALGVKTIQLRIKERTAYLADEIKRSIALAKQYQAILFVNDHWDLALDLGADAVHLGQEDLDSADLHAIHAQGLLLGVSTYCYYEVGRAHALCPSYIAIGPVYPTNSKELAFAAQGIEQLQRWRRTLNYPLVAIGGISLERAPEVVATGVSGVALISAITAAADPRHATEQLLRITNHLP